MLSQPSPIRQLCRALSGSRRRPSYQAQQRHEPVLKAAMERLAGKGPTSGSRRLPALPHRQQLPVHRQHGARLMREMGLQRPGPVGGPRTTASAPPSPRDPNLVQGWTIVRPDHGWVGRIPSVRLHKEGVS